MLTGDNGIVSQAQNAKDETVIAEEKESLGLARTACILSHPERTIVEDTELEEELKKNNKDVSVTGGTGDLEVIFNDTKHKYIVGQDGTIEQLPEGDGNYLVGSTYYDTLQEALTNAEEGATIRVMSNVTENSDITLEKDITINTNGKTINFSGEKRITINDGVNVSLNGKGTITGETNQSLILNNGNLETSNVTIESSEYGMARAAIYMMGEGILTSNNSNISSITSNTYYYTTFF